MNYIGIDHHKRSSVACTLDGQGRLLKQARIDHNVSDDNQIELSLGQIQIVVRHF